MNGIIFRRNDISAKAKGIYAFLIIYESPISKNDLGNFFKEGRDALNNAIKELIENDYIYIHSIRDNKGKFIGSEIRMTNEKESL